MCTQSITYVVKVFNTVQFCKIFSVGNYLLLLGSVNRKILKNDHSCKNALRKPDMFSLLQIITLNSMSTKFFSENYIFMFLFLYLIVFSGFVEWSKPKVLGTPPLPRRSEFYHSDPLLFTMKKKMNVKIKCLLINM